MKVKTKKVYYCDFCKKHSLRRDSLERHEKHCTLNPKRSCRLCGNTDITPIIEKYKDRYKVIEKENGLGIGHTLEIQWPKGKLNIADIFDDVDSCPACILTVLRINKLNTWPIKDELPFDYQKAMKEWWEMKNKEAHRSEMDSLIDMERE